MQLMILWGMLISGCGTAPHPSPYRVEIPILRAIPTDYQLAEGEWYRCYLREDALALGIELKAACLALGGTEVQCQIHSRPDPP
jgi:hypothetical protein